MNQPGLPDLRPAYRGHGTWAFDGPAGSVMRVTTDPASEVLQAFYGCYDRAFVIEAEKEGLEGFVDCLALNDGPMYDRLSQRFAPYREAVLTLSDPETGQVIGGASFLALGAREAGVPLVTANLSYIFVAPPYRGRGWLRRLLAAATGMATALFDLPGDAQRCLLFLEQNDPLELSAEDYARDTAHAGIDQVDRMRIWHRLGARLLRLPYTQPALSPGQAPLSGLLYGVIGAQGPSLGACLLERHLRGFFGISVLKGRDPDDDPVAGPQLDHLARACAAGGRIDLLDPAPALTHLEQGGAREAAGSFLDLLTGMTPPLSATPTRADP